MYLWMSMTEVWTGRKISISAKFQYFLRGDSNRRRWNWKKKLQLWDNDAIPFSSTNLHWTKFLWFSFCGWGDRRWVHLSASLKIKVPLQNGGNPAMKGSRHGNPTEPLAKQHRHKSSFMTTMLAFLRLNFLFTILSLQHDYGKHKKISYSTAAGASFEIRV